MDLNGLLKFPLNQLFYVIVALLIAFTVHEFSHAYVAYKLGDPTAKNQGRLSLNPLVHLDPIGTIMIFIAGFGWAKPVPVNYFYLRNKKYAGVLVSVAGPLSNLLIATVAMGIWYGLLKFQMLDSIDYSIFLAISKLFEMIISLNIILFVFNLLPFPPLDGYRVIEDLAPMGIKEKMIQLEQYGMFIFLILFITPIGDYLFSALFGTVYPFVYSSIDYIFTIIYSL